MGGGGGANKGEVNNGGVNKGGCENKPFGLPFFQRWGRGTLPPPLAPPLIVV